MKQPKNLIFIFAVAIILVALVILAWMQEDFVRDNILAPAMMLVWVIGVFLQSIPEAIFWFMGLVGALAIMGKGLGIFDRQHVKLVELPSGRLGQERIAYWARQIHLARRKKIRMSFGEQVGRLVLEMTAFQNQISTREIDRLLDEGNMDAPPVIQTFLQARRRSNYGQSGGFLANLLRRIRGESTGYDYVEEDLDKAVRYMEEQLEVEER